jgi:hypothetical protein
VVRTSEGNGTTAVSGTRPLASDVAASPCEAEALKSVTTVASTAAAATVIRRRRRPGGLDLVLMADRFSLSVAGFSAQLAHRDLEKPLVLRV